MKRLITRLRNTDKRRAAITFTLLATFGAANWALSKLIGLLIDSNPNGYSVRDAGTSGYVVGFLASFLFIDLLRRADRVLTDRFAKPTTTAK